MSAKFAIVEMDSFSVAEDLLRGISKGPDPASRRAEICTFNRVGARTMPSVNQGPELLGEDALEIDVRGGMRSIRNRSYSTEPGVTPTCARLVKC
jgi:hypothetical protein